MKKGIKIDCEHQEYCSIGHLDVKNNFCVAKGGKCRLKNTSIKELPLLNLVKKTIEKRKEKYSNLK